MGGSGPDRHDIDTLLQNLSPGILQARTLARRLEQIILDMGDGISEALYRRARDAVVRGNQEFIIADADNERVLRQLMRQGPPVTASAPNRPDIGLPGDPRPLRNMWENLSFSDREELFRLDPFLGNRNGIPQADRDFYNRRTLDALLAQARQSNDGTRAENYTGIARMLDESGAGPSRFYLTHLDNDGGLAFSLDNPDFADNTAVLLQPAHQPGRALDYARSTVEQLRQVALRAAPNSRTSVSFWGAYDQPESMVQSMFPQFAQDGAARVREYHEGLRATHEGAPAHTATIGHSYGSVLAGHSAGHGSTLDTDDLVFMGSWGTGANHVSQLRLAGVSPERTGEHVFATIATSDYVQLMPGTHGPLPTDRAFGATAFDSSSRFSGFWNPLDHAAESYLHSANPASGNIGLVITGHGDLVARPA
ncbi:alpha/beta hydrolase [Nocardia carnea]|uniref:alpha/beta hydrolase n=1 Tax=Nocardia carnea TaxID=37328 RepID=UPI0024550CCD|nr:alpha/beta hydrolase [Nocardia carnea]